MTETPDGRPLHAWLHDLHNVAVQASHPVANDLMTLAQRAEDLETLQDELLKGFDCDTFTELFTALKGMFESNQKTLDVLYPDDAADEQNGHTRPDGQSTPEDVKALRGAALHVLGLREEAAGDTSPKELADALLAMGPLSAVMCVGRAAIDALIECNADTEGPCPVCGSEEHAEPCK